MALSFAYPAFGHWSVVDGRIPSRVARAGRLCPRERSGWCCGWPGGTQPGATGESRESWPRWAWSCSVFGVGDPAPSLRALLHRARHPASACIRHHRQLRRGVPHRGNPDHQHAPSVPSCERVSPERFIGTVRRECLDRLLAFNCLQLEQVLSEFFDHYDGHRPDAASIWKCRPGNRDRSPIAPCSPPRRAWTSHP